MPRRRKDCPICCKRNLVKLSNHLADIHQLSRGKRRYQFSKTKPLGDQSESEEMSFPNRMRNESDDEMSTVSRGEDIEERHESDDETDSMKIFSVHPLMKMVILTLLLRDFRLLRSFKTSNSYFVIFCMVCLSRYPSCLS